MPARDHCQKCFEGGPYRGGANGEQREMMKAVDQQRAYSIGESLHARMNAGDGLSDAAYVIGH
jgi:hypothetical protein